MSVIFIKVVDFLPATKCNTPVFQVFKIVQMIPNRATHQIFVIPKAVDTPLNSTLIPAISQCFLCLLSAPANMINDSNSRMTNYKLHCQTNRHLTAMSCV